MPDVFRSTVRDARSIRRTRPTTPCFHRTDRFAAPTDRAATDFTHCYARRSSNDGRIPYTAGV
ncbi:hypothetical protein CO709_08835 [Burkholderia thailandensis]|nr:hypothetical protein CO709_08835 [Burkholderia thailandensis]